MTSSTDGDGDTETAFDVATDADNRVNDMLADSDGIQMMAYNGAIGYHIHVASGESDPEFLWKIALLEALDESVLEMMHVDESHPKDAREQLERQLGDSFDPVTAAHVADLFEENLTDLIDVQERAGDVDADGDQDQEGDA